MIDSQRDVWDLRIHGLKNSSVGTAIKRPVLSLRWQNVLQFQKIITFSDRLDPIALIVCFSPVKLEYNLYILHVGPLMEYYACSAFGALNFRKQMQEHKVY